MSADTVNAAIGAASLDNARRIERQRRGPVESPNASFYRGGKTGAQSDAFRADLRARFAELSSPGLLAAGYLPAAAE